MLADRTGADAHLVDHPVRRVQLPDRRGRLDDLVHQPERLARVGEDAARRGDDGQHQRGDHGDYGCGEEPAEEPVTMETLFAQGWMAPLPPWLAAVTVWSF